MGEIKIITIGYNEEKNLPKLYQSLQKIKDILPHQKIYIDQSSTDNSIEIARKYGCNIYIHPNQGYADPDKKWAIDELCNDDEWILILDADEELSIELGKEISYNIKNNNYHVFDVAIDIIFMGISISGKQSLQKRLFKKSSILATITPHHYIQSKTNHIGRLRNSIKNNDFKNQGSEIRILLEKLNRYTDKEIQNINSISRYKLLYQIFIKPIIRFFGFGLWWGYFFKGIPGLTLSLHNGIYEFFKGIKLYEKFYIKSHTPHEKNT